MVHLKIVSGKMAGTEKVARHFPFKIGRAASADLQIVDDGVWEDHLELAFVRREGFVLATRQNALVTVNAQSVQTTTLRNGDTIEIGSLKIRFWLGPTHQASLRAREWGTWIGFGLVTALQLYLIYCLVP